MTHVRTRGNDNFAKNKRFYMTLMDVGGRLRTVIWRRERDSNHKSASPYPFEMSIDFGKVGTTDIRYLACTLWLSGRIIHPY